MGRRSRKRTGPGGPVVRPAPVTGRAAPAPPPVADRRARKLEAPKAPWAPFPLVELAVLVGMVLILVGFLLGGDQAGRLLVIGFSLVSLAGLELSVREHLAGYRSHSTLLAGATAILLVVPLFFLTSLPSEVLLILGAAFFAAAFQGLRSVFTRRSGGLGFRA
ncbi:MAG: hypothetical protein JWO90_1501 [Solirubrobacterales bacterium]|jgi:hypothetical protein|nr:hypothetical protein [Solirubrobacterales bacterium]